MKNTKKKYTKLPMQIGVLLAPVLALLGIILQSVALFVSYDPSSDYYVGTFRLPAFLPLFFGCVGLLLLIYTLAIRRRIPAAPNENTLTVYFSGAFLILALTVAALCTVFSLPAQEDIYLRVLAIGAAVTAFASFIYMALVLRKDRLCRLRSALSVAPVLFALISAMYLYFDKSLQMNAPYKLLQIFAYLLLACYGLSECRNMIGRAKPALNFFVSSVTAVACACASLPTVIYTAVRQESAGLSIAGDFVLFAFFLYILARILQLLPSDSIALHRLVGSFLSREEENEENPEEELAQETFDFPEDKEEAGAEE